jgi:RES domain-containing protein
VSIEVGYRISDWDTPLRVNPNRSAGRFNGAGSPATQYIGLHPLTPWAEYLRFHDLRGIAEIAERRLTIWALRLEIDSATAIGFDNAGEHALQPADLVDDDYGPCQELGDRLRADAAAPKTIIVPSGALPGTQNVVIFAERVGIPYLWSPIDELDLPACVVAGRAAPPPALIDNVRFRGERHAEFEAWLSGQRYDFADLAA